MTRLGGGESLREWYRNGTAGAPQLETFISVPVMYRPAFSCLKGEYFLWPHKH